MKKFMVIVEGIGMAWTQFFDEYQPALTYARSAEVNGWLIQIYQWDKQDDCYKFLQE